MLSLLISLLLEPAACVPRIRVLACYVACLVLQKMHARWPSQYDVNHRARCMSCDGKPCLPVELVTGIFVLPVACTSEGKSATSCCKHFQQKVTQLPVVVSISDGKSCDFLLLQAFLMECPENLVFFLQELLFGGPNYL